MIKKSKQKTYYETELIDAVVCDKCGKDLIEEDDSFNIINIDTAYCEKGDKSLTDLSIGFTKHLCQDCAKPILELLD